MTATAHLSTDLRIAITPAETFPLLIAERQRGSWPAALSRPAFVAFVLGCVTSIAPTGVVSAISILSGTLCWSFVPAVQVVMALWLCRRPPSSRVDRVRSFELLFLAHAPWTLWIVFAGISLTFARLTPATMTVLLASSLAPGMWTRRIMLAFSGQVLGCDRTEAGRRTRIHQSVTWAVILVYVGWAIGVVPRLIGLV